ncbi:MAG TPA: tyrosine/phenylalanine carboxypeptidase domain-containing protein [Acidimicrobiia bacterium]|nr:tyrosine/phenylalanine carboxypeptidase domain-containing protein [Acidimicrobiia bacterium]
MPVGTDDLAVDRELSEIAGALPLLQLITPINVAEQRAKFETGEVEAPNFEYRPMPDLSSLASRLADVDPERADDPAVAHLAAALKRALTTRLELLSSRGTPRFFLAAVELFGHVDPDLYELALDLTDLEPESSGPGALSAQDFAATARREIDRYRADYPELAARVEVSETISGVLVENGDLYIGSDTRIASDHVDSLLQHEVGVHVLTYANGSAQPLRMLAVGLAGYDENQEALGVLAEHLAGGLRRTRLRALAYRVVAAQMRSEDATFRQTYDLLQKLGAGRRIAFSTTMRAYRAGGLTKDAIYLRGLVRLCRHLAAGGDIERLFIGKVGLEDVALIAELRQREVLGPPPLRPRFLDSPSARRRLDEIGAGANILHLTGANT